MTEKRLTLFPELDEWTRVIYSHGFIKSCAHHITGLGYTSQYSNDQICIVDPQGESSCHPGTLVGWRFVNEIEKFVSDNGFPWFTDSQRTQVEVSKGFSIISQLAGVISELICKHEQ